MESKANNLAYPLSDTEKESLMKKDDMVDVLFRADLFANDKDLHTLPSLGSVIARAALELAEEC